MTLKTGVVAEDPRLDRVQLFDERSRSYPITAVITATKPRSYTWHGGPVTDQGREGACVGHGWTGELTARPQPVALADPTAYAYDLYHRVQHRDPWPGCSLGNKCTLEPAKNSRDKYDGTSVLSAAQELADRGLVKEYRWAFGLDDLVLAVGYKGPAVIGVPWYDGMYEAPNGKVSVSGSLVGGHCLLVRGVSVKRRELLWRNSWGPDYGVGGDAWISFDDMGRLLSEGGEACIPVRRAK